jgi:hypothetical protein
VLERDDGTVLAFEIKTGKRIDSSDMAGIRALRSKIGDDGHSAVIVLYSGAHAYTHEDRVQVLPQDSTHSGRRRPD